MAEHSQKFDKVRRYYRMYIESNGSRGWSMSMVWNAVVKGWITQEEFTEITGENN